eukprot:COSAG03_NODE_8050_length_842_cov_0.873486_1_plen_240_part_01
MVIHEPRRGRRPIMSVVSRAVAAGAAPPRARAAGVVLLLAFATMSGRPATALLWTMLPLLLLLDISTIAAATARPPFSWDTVPVFAETSNVTGPFDARALATLRRFPLFVAEKAYDYPGPGFAEDKLTALAGHLRQLNPEIFLVFYYNANLDMDDYRLNAMSAAAAPSWWLRNSSGVPLVAPVDSGAGARPPFPYASNSLGGLHCWDHTNPTVREAWVQVCVCVCLSLSLSVSLSLSLSV